MLSHTKEKIIDILNKELDVLSKEYDKKINYLQEENRRLKNELVAAKRHHNPNAALQQQITELQSKYNMLSSFVSENVDIKFILCFFDQLSKYSSSEGLFAESLFLRLCFEENKLNLISPIIKHLGSEKSVLQQLQRNSLHLLIDTLNDIFEEELPQIEEVDDIYLSILQLILRLWDTEAERTLSHWLVDNYEVIQHRIIDTNAPGLMLYRTELTF